MAQDSFSEVTSESVFGRLLNSIKAVIFGLLLFVGSIALLWWNEGKLAREKATLAEMAGQVVHAEAAQPDPANNGKLLHLIGQLASTEKLADSPYLKSGAFLKLDRKVEMFQWVEEEHKKSEKKLGGGTTTTTTYTYVTKWEPGREDSGKFHYRDGHENPNPQVQPAAYQVRSSTFGGYDGAAIMQKLAASSNVSLSADALESGQKADGGFIYLRKNPGTSGDQVGDERISYTALLPGQYSVLARQVDGSHLDAFHSSNGNDRLLVQAGSFSPEEMIATAKSNAKLLALVLRIAGFVLMWIALVVIVDPIAVVLDIVPFMGSLGRGVFGLIAGVVAAIISVVVIIVSMIAHNFFMLLGAAALVVAGAVMVLHRKAGAAAR